MHCFGVDFCLVSEVLAVFFLHTFFPNIMKFSIKFIPLYTHYAHLRILIIEQGLSLSLYDR